MGLLVAGSTVAHQLHKGFAETSRVLDILAGPGDSMPDQMLGIGDTLFFVATDSTSPINFELWRSRGDFSNTIPVMELPGSVNPQELTEVNGRLYYVQNSADFGFELWQAGSDGGAAIVADLRSGQPSSFPRGLTAVGDLLFFSADDGVAGRELWVLDTVAGQPSRVADLTPGEDDTVFFVNPTGGPNTAATENLLFFVADDGVSGRELWRSDGTEAGTFVFDINPGPDSSMSFSIDPVVPAPLDDMVVAGNRLFFAADDGQTGRELWVSDGTVEGTRLVLDIREGPLSGSPDDLVPFGVEVIFVAGNGANGLEPWISNGEPTGTQMLRDIQPGPQSSDPGLFTFVDGLVYFVASDPQHGGELWRTNGSSAGTSLAADIYPGSESSFPSKMVAGADGLAYFFADDGVHGVELWRSDGEPQNTRLVADILPGPASSGPFNRMASTDQRVYLQADDGTTGFELHSVSTCPTQFQKQDAVCERRPLRPPKKISVVFLDNLPGNVNTPNTFVPASEFRVVRVGGDYVLKAINENGVQPLDPSLPRIPEPGGAELYGNVREVFTGRIYQTPFTDQDFDGLPDSLEPTTRTSADSNGDFIPDVTVDADNDGLDLADEIYLGLNPNNPDTDGDGLTDGLDIALARTSRQYTVFPLVVNDYTKEADNPQSALREIILRANDLLQSAGITLVLSGFQRNATAGDAMADGMVNGQDEFNAIRSAGLAEVLPQSKGIKVSVMKSGDDTILLPGSKDPNAALVSAAGASNDLIPFIMLKQGTNLDYSARTLVHELGHVLGLEHPDEDGNAQTVPEPQFVMTGGSPEVFEFVNSGDSDKGLANVLFAEPNFAKLRAAPALAAWGQKGRRQSPARRVVYGSGQAVDPEGDHSGPNYLDLTAVQLVSDGEADSVALTVSVEEAFPSVDGEQALFRILLDSDGNDASGDSILGRSGIDWDLELAVFRVDGELNAVAQATRLPGGSPELLLPGPVVETQQFFVDAEVLPLPVLELGGRLTLTLTTEFLGLADSDIPVTVLTMTDGGIEADDLQVTLRNNRWTSDPSMELDREIAAPGTSVTFTLAGLTPLENYELFVGNTVLATGTLDASGTATGAFSAPSAASENLQFVLARDEQGEVADSVLIVPIGLFADGFED
ncbi:MAG: ELWxxDGT repeat protein [Pseudomonadota bacterium]